MFLPTSSLHPGRPTCVCTGRFSGVRSEATAWDLSVLSADAISGFNDSRADFTPSSGKLCRSALPSSLAEAARVDTSPSPRLCTVLWASGTSGLPSGPASPVSPALASAVSASPAARAFDSLPLRSSPFTLPVSREAWSASWPFTASSSVSPFPLVSCDPASRGSPLSETCCGKARGSTGAAVRLAGNPSRAARSVTSASGSASFGSFLSASLTICPASPLIDSTCACTSSANTPRDDGSAS